MFASGPTYCAAQKKKTLNDGSGVEFFPNKNGSYRVVSVCAECGKKKSVIVGKEVHDAIVKADAEGSEED